MMTKKQAEKEIKQELKRLKTLTIKERLASIEFDLAHACDSIERIWRQVGYRD
jgi:hypothetical protein